jgi:hypothetical protein
VPTEIRGISLQVILDSKLPKRLPEEPVVAIGDFEPSEQVIVYKSDPEKPGESALQQFYRDLIFGRPLPLKLVAREIRDIDEAMILTLFLDRKLAIEPKTSSVVFWCDLARFGPAGLAHVDPDFAELISWVREYLVISPEPERVKHVVEWLQKYVSEGSIPSGPPPSGGPPRILDVGTNGFVVAEVPWGTNLPSGWTELYRQGHLRGVLFEAMVRGGPLRVLGARKSPLVALDLARAAGILNEAEKAMGEGPGWVSEEDLWLWGPEDGTQLLPSAIIQVLVRL